MGLENDAYRYAIKNAYEHKGRAAAGALIGKMKALHKEKEVKEIMPVVVEQIKKINSMPFSDIEKEFRKLKEGYELKPQEGRVGLAPLEWAEQGEKVITRFAPNPNGLMHLGHARAAYLSFLYAEKYGGKFILRFEDTDPKVKKSIPDSKRLFKEDLGWLGVKIDEIYYASDRMDKYYDYMRKLIDAGNAYVCTMDSEKWRKLTRKGIACEEREKGKEYHLELFEKMLSNEVKEGEAVLRIKTDLKHPDPSVRDWWIARVVDNALHPRVGDKYHVWPSYMFQSAIDDHEMGVTFILRGQEHSQNQTKQEFLCKYFGWKYPHASHFGRMSIEGMELSTSKIREGIEKGEFDGWDDIRLGTIRAVKRRGFKAEAIKKIIVDSGLTSSDAKFSLEKMAAYNKGMIIEEAERISFITDPVKLRINFEEKFITEKDGNRIVFEKGEKEILVSESELKKVKGNRFRLRKLGDVGVKEKGALIVEGKFIEKQERAEVLAWVFDKMDLNLKITDGTVEVGATERRNFKKGDYLQLEKIGYAIVDSEAEPIAWFTHP